MRQAVMTAPGKIEFRDVPPPEVGPGEVRLRIRRIGVCGSDVHVNHGKHPFTTYPVVQGHEYSAIVESVGPGVTTVHAGMNVTARPQIVCGTCGPCQRGDYHICDHLKVQGFQAPGCAQDLFVVKEGQIVPLPDDFTPEQGAMVEPVSVAVHAVGRAGGAIRGQNVAVLGTGPIGNLVAQVARCAGGNVLCTDLSDYRLAIAANCGLTHTSNANHETLADASRRVFGDAGFSLAFECVGVEATMTQAVGAIAKGGTIVVVGVFAQPPRVNLGLVQDRELALLGTLMYKHEDYEKAVELIDTGRVKTAPLDNKHFPFEHYLEAYRYIDAQGDRCVKVFVDL